jgi:hypothetical protein
VQSDFDICQRFGEACYLHHQGRTLFYLEDGGSMFLRNQRRLEANIIVARKGVTPPITVISSHSLSLVILINWFVGQ